LRWIVEQMMSRLQNVLNWPLHLAYVPTTRMRDYRREADLWVPISSTPLLAHRVAEHLAAEGGSLASSRPTLTSSGRTTRHSGSTSPGLRSDWAFCSEWAFLRAADPAQKLQRNNLSCWIQTPYITRIAGNYEVLPLPGDYHDRRVDNI